MGLRGRVLLAAAVLVGWWFLRPHPPIVRPPGILIQGSPIQEALAQPLSFSKGDYTLQAVATFSLEARVLGRQDYHTDRGAALAPLDLALGWGRMSDSQVLAQLSISQSGRFYHYRWRGSPPIPPAEIVVSSANMHLIPANPQVERQLRKVRPGHLIRLKGYLVNAQADNFFWKTSTTRQDSGNGACELIWVEAVSLTG